MNRRPRWSALIRIVKNPMPLIKRINIRLAELNAARTPVNSGKLPRKNTDVRTKQLNERAGVKRPDDEGYQRPR